MWSGLTAIGSDPNQQRLVDVNGDGYLDWISIHATTGATSLFMHGKAQGVQLGYDGASNRRTATSFDDTTDKRYTEYYTFDTANRLVNTYRLSQVLNTKTGLLETKRDYTSERFYDTAGRVVQFVAYSAPGKISNTTVNTYDANNRLLIRATFGPNPKLDYAGNPKPDYTVDYSLPDSYAPDGRVLSYKVIVPGSYTNTYTTTYLAFEGYKQLKELGKSTYFSSGKTNFSYDVNGHLTKVTDANDATKKRTFRSNALGEFLIKTDDKGKQQYFQYAGGVPIGSHGEMVDANFDYNYTPVSENYPATTPGQYVANEGDTVQRAALAVYGDAKLWYLIADANGLDASSVLTVGQVLTIPNRITNLYNDAGTLSLYNAGLIIGSTTPTTPAPPPPKGDNARLFMAKSSILSVAFGFAQPGHLEAAIWHYSKRDEKPGRAFLAEVHNMAGHPDTAYWVKNVANDTQVRNNAILLSIIIAIVITVCSWGAATGAGAAFIAMGFAIASSLASQTILVGSGVQQNYNWGAVATSAVAAGITAGIGAGGVAKQVFDVSATSTTGMMINAAATNVINQGLNLVTGQQKRFDWASLAAVVVAAGIVGSFTNAKFFEKIDTSGATGNLSSSTSNSTGSFWNKVGGLVGGKVLSTAVSMNGGPEWAQVAADSFGNALGGALVDGIRPPETRASTWGGSGFGESIVNDMLYGTPTDRNPVNQAPPSPSTTSYVTQSGDNLWNISKQQLKGLNLPTDNASVLAQEQRNIGANSQLTSPSNLSIGQEINLADPTAEISDLARLRYERAAVGDAFRPKFFAKLSVDDAVNLERAGKFDPEIPMAPGASVAWAVNEVAQSEIGSAFMRSVLEHQELYKRQTSLVVKASTGQPEIQNAIMNQSAPGPLTEKERLQLYRPALAGGNFIALPEPFPLPTGSPPSLSYDAVHIGGAVFQGVIKDAPAVFVHEGVHLETFGYEHDSVIGDARYMGKEVVGARVETLLRIERGLAPRPFYTEPSTGRVVDIRDLSIYNSKGEYIEQAILPVPASPSDPNFRWKQWIPPSVFNPVFKP